MSESKRYESGLVVENRGHVRVLTLDRPERRNALSTDVQADLVEELLDAAEGGTVRALVLTGNGPAFCAGFDLKEIRAQDERGERFRPPMGRPGRSIFEVVTETPIPVVAALQGHAVAGGFELALACDLRVAAPGIKLGLPEATIGMGANFGSVVLPKRIPMGIALEMLLVGEYVSSEDAERWGLVNRIVDTDDVLSDRPRPRREDRRERPDQRPPHEGDRRQGRRAPAVAGPAPRRRPQPLPQRGPPRGHRRLPGEAPPGVARPLGRRAPVRPTPLRVGPHCGPARR
ncbi:enoyl-CoA hydratase/isomerase family protein [Blastococcus sp. TML/C7B]|uniref:enoyl-CoA hydratase/isomerase family protein n=1 Tax=Blastococcus sp. TML/C7B TaxID=2798728 RepID=UPI002814E36F|nr:enoyl-CoA hydratase/isomerase family protein [Blastococcus sp. TML/C7B]